MTKKTKILSVIKLVHFVIMIFLLIAIFLALILKAEGVKFLILIFLCVLLVGFIGINIFTIFTYEYVCPNCNKNKHLNFTELIFAKTDNNQRKLKCKYCGKIAYMEKKPR